MIVRTGSAACSLARAGACEPPAGIGRRSRVWYACRFIGRFVSISILVATAIIMLPPYESTRDTPAEIAKATVKKYVYEAYPEWAIEHPDARCPTTLAELNQWMGQSIAFDPWGLPYRSSCDAEGRVLVWSAGEDRRFATEDDIRSDG
jgi:hypothetical protein